MIRRIIWIDRKRCDGLGDCPPFYPQQAFRFETRKVHSANGQKNRKSGNRSAGGRLFSVNMADKLMTVLSENRMERFGVLQMEGPCCGGLQKAVDMALHRNTKRLPVKMPVIGRQGEIAGQPI